LGQTVPPEEIWVWTNYHEDQLNFDWDGCHLWLEEHGIKIFTSNFNWKYCGRFAAACLVDTEYTAIFDDDTIPGPKWFENCLNTLDTPYNFGILGGIGLRLHSDFTYNEHTRYGWAEPNESVVEVDLVGHAWFFPAHFIRYMWYEKPMWATGEDMHFSAMCQKYGNIKTYVPPHPKDDKDMHSSLFGNELGIDAVASSRVQNHATFFNERNICLQRLVNFGWSLYKDRDSG
jgi:hypothetical protein